MTFTPEEFRRIRKRRGWTQAQAANEFGVSPGTIANIERGSRREDGRPVKCPRYIEIISQHLTLIDLQTELIEAVKKRADLLESLLAISEKKDTVQ